MQGLFGTARVSVQAQPSGLRWLVAILLLATAAAAAESVTGRASVIDGDTLEIHGTRFRLWGIDAPESSQLCRDDDSKHFRCGAKAANSLADFIGNRPVSCIEVDRDRYDRRVGVCTVDNIDLADWLVRNGLAFDWPRYSKNAYAEAQRQAEQNERGLWTGSFSMPWQFRACVRKGRRASECSDEAR